MGIPGGRPYPCAYVDAEDLISGLHASTASSSSLEPSPRPHSELAPTEDEDGSQYIHLSDPIYPSDRVMGMKRGEMCKACK